MHAQPGCRFKLDVKARLWATEPSGWSPISSTHTWRIAACSKPPPIAIHLSRACLYTTALLFQGDLAALLWTSQRRGKTREARCRSSFCRPQPPREAVLENPNQGASGEQQPRRKTVSWDSLVCAHMIRRKSKVDEDRVLWCSV